MFRFHMLFIMQIDFVMQILRPMACRVSYMLAGHQTFYLKLWFSFALRAMKMKSSMVNASREDPP